MVWLLVGVQSLPDMFYTKTFRNGTGKCYETTSKAYVEDYLKYSLGWTFTGFCIPFLITLGCYGHVIFILCCKNTTDKEFLLSSYKLLRELVRCSTICFGQTLAP
ncbi:P2Y purinoceptor 1-like protein [Lates japonicus]|uniref:P2Y purinoceptor 1-like protein n=1 Tax=Lates japonicus TaxID=270547 RepID=A0AAD3R0K6_LATJO|nr:P2Y purinoceptor 1-like protein [Lates japonicus]